MGKKNMEILTGTGESCILLVEDDKEIREGIEIFLRGQGYKVFQAADGIEGLKILEREEIHLAVVDIMMPRMDGITMVIKLREKYDFPVIFLSAKSEEVDKIMGLNMGADDYITKPFTPMEFKILALLIRSPGRVFSAEEIYERVWNERAINTDTIMVHVRNIREKIEINPKNPKYLKVVWGVGYKIEKQ